ncbi:MULTISPECIES: putative sulfate/molybdate transporter [Marinobacter]|uniref:Sulfate/molybdate transporter n=1 Tax=Marinobacter xiaoshiensis TaxID=3073652 RepID=A0ABU2HE70_9GAMM|nr:MULTISPECIES: putative sulfate/molybdate transporter [unclassified Marinobacter]MBK1873968.1 putative sulfate/molybdate transporter [Marinobacter sp. 1-3A]MBK1887946.1 putative sulfate/molybdate transporter [Marinobacter sp. DY40_1A1]MDS1308625.1 putative sulfate/molybdate transporter [Marinobacter sp. F60267]
MPSVHKNLVKNASGALGDLGTLIPLGLGAVGVAGLAPVPVLLGFAIFYIATGLYYRLPVPVQPMKAVAALLLTTQVSPQSLVASGVLIGGILLILGVTGWINGAARLIPRSVLSGLQLGLGLMLAHMSVGLMATSLPLGIVTLALLGATLKLLPHWPAALIGLIGSVALGTLLGAQGLIFPAADSVAFSLPELPGFKDWQQGLSTLVLPQLALTLTNAIVLTALVVGDYFGEQSHRVTPARLSISTGLANLFLVPFGALPMCHGAGGVAAHHRFGARTGMAPVLLGTSLLLIALIPGGLAMIAAIPMAGLGALLFVAAAELALSKRLWTAKPSCWPVIAITAVITVWTDPFFGLLAGVAAETVRTALLRRRKIA